MVWRGKLGISALKHLGTVGRTSLSRSGFALTLQSPGLAQPVRVPTATSLRAYALAWEKNMMYSPNFKSKHPPCELNFSFLSVYCLSVSTSKLMVRPINLIWLAHVDKHWSTAKIRCRLRSHLKSERKRIISGHSSKNDTENTAGDGRKETLALEGKPHILSGNTTFLSCLEEEVTGSWLRKSSKEGLIPSSLATLSDWSNHAPPTTLLAAVTTVLTQVL